MIEVFCDRDLGDEDEPLEVKMARMFDGIDLEAGFDTPQERAEWLAQVIDRDRGFMDGMWDAIKVYVLQIRSQKEDPL
jgi:hypothetical protein